MPPGTPSAALEALTIACQVARVFDCSRRAPETLTERLCWLGLEGIVSKRLGSPYRSGRSRHWVKSKNPAAPAVKREAEEDWGK